MSQTDLIIIGSGPSAIRLGAHTARSGIQTTILAPNPKSAWKPNYGAWADELEEYQVPRSTIEATWRSSLVVTRSGGERDLDRRYARVHTARFQSHELAAAAAAGVRFIDAQAAEVTHTDATACVTTTAGHQHLSTLVVDATGAGHFTRYGAGALPGWQVAYGQLAVVDAHPWDMGEMVLMDFRASTEGAPPRSRGKETDEVLPSFLYAMPLGRNLVFLEETVLVSRPEADMSLLAERLTRRLHRMGIRRREVLEEEHCRIRMGGPLPDRNQRTLSFGAAAGLVHPATGYSLAQSLRFAPQVSDALVEGLGAGSPEQAISAAWEALWPKPRVRTHQLHQFGMDVLCRLDRDQTGRFFDAFFELPADQWQGYLDATLPPAGVARAMAGLFVRADLDLQRLLLGTGASSSGTSLLRSVVGA